MRDGGESESSERERELTAENAELSAEVAELRLKLQRAEARATLVERASNVGVWDLDPRTGSGSWSPKVYDLYYLDREGPAPALDDMAKLVHPDDVAAVQTNLGQLLTTGNAPPVVFRTHPSMGPNRVLRAMVHRLDDGDGVPVMLTGAIADITQMTIIEGELAASTNRLDALLTHTPYQVVTVERDRTISYINHLPDGVSAESVLGQRYESHIHPDHLPKVEAMLERVFERGEGGMLEVLSATGRIWDARYVPLVSATGGSEAVETALVFTIDVTEQRKLESQLQHAQKLDSLGVLAGGIAHDFNNLLVGILGNADLVLMDLPEDSPARESIEEILTSSHRAADLCRQMLAYSGKGRFVVRVMEIGSVVREMAHLLEVSISKRATLRHVSDGPTKPIKGDMSQIRQVVMNLITNASDALQGEDGVITATTGTKFCDQTYLADSYLKDDLPSGEYTYVEVSDTGVGMDEATRERMFEPFFSSKEEGRGLGLAAAQGIVRSHGGALQVESEVGKGTTIRVLFPASTEELEDAGKRDPARWSGTGRLLVVDDEAGVRRLADRMLSRLGFEVLTAENGAEGVALFREHDGEFAGVVLDMTMPVMDGKAAFAEMRRVDPNVRVLLTSGYNEQDATSRFAGEGPAGFLQKPFRADALVSALRELLGER